MTAGTFISGVAVFSAQVKQLQGWRRAAIAFVAGAISVLALAPFFASPVLFITLPIFVWLIEARTDSKGARAGSDWWRIAWRAGTAGWWFGFGFHLAGLYWIGYAFMVQADQFAWLLPFAVTLLPACLAIFHGLAGAATALLLSRLAPPLDVRSETRGGFFQAFAPVTTFAVAISATEWLRGNILTGFPWNLLGYALTWPLELMQSAGLIGIYGLTLATPLVFATPLIMIASKSWPGASAGRRASIATVIVAGLTGSCWLYGAALLAKPNPPTAQDIKLRLVQPSIDQKAKWRADKQREIFEEHLRLSRVGADGKPDGLKGITHVIWAEAAMPFMPLETPEAAARIGELLPKTVRLLAGSLRRDLDESGAHRVYNSLVTFGADGKSEGLYDKIHLVPFGEYLPLSNYLEAIGLRALVGQRGGFAAGVHPRPVMRVAGLVPMSPLICYEVIFPGQIIQGAERPHFLLNVTNDGWFGRSTGPYQHLHQARLRSVEEGLPLIRVSNNGVSAVIDARGRIVHLLGLHVKGVIDSRLPGAGAQPVFARYGNAIYLFLWLIVWVGVLLGRART